MLDGRDFQSLGHEMRQEARQQSRLAGTAPAREPNHLHSSTPDKPNKPPGKAGRFPSIQIASVERYSAGTPRGGGPAGALACASSAQSEWCSRAQLTSTSPVPMASNAPSMPSVPI